VVLLPPLCWPEGTINVNSNATAREHCCVLTATSTLAIHGYSHGGYTTPERCWGRVVINGARHGEQYRLCGVTKFSTNNQIT